MSTIEAFRSAIATVVGTEFAVELAGVPVDDGPLDTQAGSEGVRAAVYSDGWSELPQDVNRREIFLSAVFHDQFGDDLIDNADTSPASLIEGYSDRMVAAIKTIRTSTAWYVRVRRVEFFNDPTGDRTRFRCVVSGWDDNPFSF